MVDCVIVVKAWFFWCAFCVSAKCTVVDTVFSAQASVSRPGETNRGSPRLLRANCRPGDWISFWARRDLDQVRMEPRIRRDRCSKARVLA